jgi:hypothetical protein
VSSQGELKRGIANVNRLSMDQVVRFDEGMAGWPQAGIEDECNHRSARFSQVVGRDF